MKNNVKRFLVSVMAGIMMINTPLSVLAETPVNKSTEQDSSSDYTDSSVTAQILFKQESVVNYLSSLNEEDKANILSELSEKENYQLVMLALYDHINHFSKDQTLDLYKEIINSYNEKLSFDYENSTDEEKNERSELLKSWKDELLTYLDTEETTIESYETNLITSKGFDAKKLYDTLSGVLNSNTEDELAEAEKDYQDFQNSTFSSVNDKAQNDNIKYEINSISDYSGKESYKVITVDVKNASKLSEYLPKEIAAEVTEIGSEDSKEMNIPVSWSSSSEVKEDEETVYCFKSSFDKEYKLSDELNSSISDGDYFLPVCYVVTEDQSIVTKIKSLFTSNTAKESDDSDKNDSKDKLVEEKLKENQEIQKMLEEIGVGYADSYQKNSAASTKRKSQKVRAASAKASGETIQTAAIKKNIAQVDMVDYNSSYPDGYKIIDSWKEGMLGNSSTNEALYCTDPTLTFSAGSKTAVDASSIYNKQTIQTIVAMQYYFDHYMCKSINSDYKYLFKQCAVWVILNGLNGWYKTSVVLETGNGVKCSCGDYVANHMGSYRKDGLAWAKENYKYFADAKGTVYQGKGQPLSKWSGTYKPGHTNTINHWLTGFKNGEGNNGSDNTSYKMQVTTFASTDGSQALFNTERRIAIPKGFYLDNSVYIASQKKSYNMPVSFTSNADIYASYFYRPYTYQISYDLGGGTNNSKNPSSYNVMYGELLSNPTKSGATFNGWTQENNLIGDSTYNYTFTNSNSQNSYSYGKIQICGIKSDKTWETSGPDISTSSTSGHVSTSYTHTKNTGLYSLRIAANGTKEDKSDYLRDVYFEKDKEYKIEYDIQFSAQKVVMNNITVKRVSKVTGINYGKNATPLATSNYYSIASQRQIGNIRLKANWIENAPSTPKTYTNTLKYDANGGTGAPATQTQTVTYPNTSCTFTVSQTKPTRNGYTFNGWYDAATGGSKVGSSVTVGSNNVNSNQSKTIYAHWTANQAAKTYTNTLKYDANGGTGAPATQTQTVTYPNTSCTFTVSQTKPTRNGYTFNGWYDAATGGSKVGSSVVVGSTYANSNQSKTIYAHWTANQAAKTYTNTLKYDANGGTGAPANQTATVTYPNTQSTFRVSSIKPTRTGHTFLGWYDAATGGNKIGTTVTVGSNNHEGNQTKTIYAHWSANEYTNTLKYDANGGTGAPASQTAKVAYPNTQSTFRVSSVKPTRTGHTFLGWYDAATGGNKIGTTVTVGSNNHEGNQSKTIYAHWQRNSYYLSLDGFLDGKLKSNIDGYGTADVYVDGKLVANDVTDFYQQIPFESTYEIKDIKANVGHTYNGVYSGTIKGTMPASDTKVVLNFTTNTYTIKYNSNKPSTASGTISGTTPDSVHTYGVAKTLTPNGYKLTGWTFTGWKDSNGNSYKDGQSVINLTAQKGAVITLYAQWEPNTYTITIKPNGGKLNVSDGTITKNSDGTATVHVTYDSTNYYSLGVTASRDGYAMQGFFDNTSGGTKLWNNGGNCLNDGKYWLNNKWHYPGNITVYAQWDPYTLTINYHNDGATKFKDPGTETTIDVTGKDIVRVAKLIYDEDYSSEWGLPNVNRFTKTGYHSGGLWFVDYMGSSTRISDSASLPKAQDIANAAGKLDQFKKGSITIDLYPYLIPNTYTIKYDGNGATSGSTPDSNMTYDKPGELNKNGFKKDNATFIGWKDENGNVYKDGETVKNLTPVDKGVVILKAQWDLAPTISAGEKTYYEGTTVTRDDLLKEVTATDPEDGTITNRIIITKIEYSAGKLVSGKKQPSYTQEWKDGMPKEATLDTWFMQLDKADSPVKHKVTYKVVDKVGNVTTKTVTVYVKYNNPPVITAVDRYFTLKEAQNGKVTADELLKNAIEKDKLKSTDIEEGVLSPKLELVGFNPADFTKLTTSAVVTVTYKVHDSYGPNGIGKETVNQIRVHITDPKQPIPGDSQMMQHVRFVTKKYYDLNKDRNIKDYLNNDSELAKINSNGGLRVGCNWYSKDEYKFEITETFDKTSGTTYKFSHEDVKKIQDYINTNGIGNAKKADSLSTFYQKFLNK